LELPCPCSRAKPLLSTSSTPCRTGKRGKALPPLPVEEQNEDNRVRGCSSQVWLTAQRMADSGHIRYRADSDAIIVRGLVAILLRIYDDAPAKDILATNADFIPELGLDSHLSANRANGLAAMVRQIKTYALALSAPSAT
jgi:cysteine desulfuration protein SufE